MAELLPEQVGSQEDDSKAAKPKRWSISTILEWIQCFGIYIAIIARKDPTRVTDLLGYQHLIIQFHQEYQGDCWLSYDCRFRQKAAALPSSSRSAIDPTLWNLAEPVHLIAVIVLAFSQVWRL